MKDDEPDLGQICFVGGDLTEFSVRRFGSEIRRLDLSFNVISKLKGLEVCAESLEELILDNNQLEHVELLTGFPALHTLSLNKNKVSSLDVLLEDLKWKAPNLRYLSLLGNPICPDQLSDDFVDESDYQIYRYHVLYHLKFLKFLDHRQVTLRESLEAQKPLYGNLKTYPTVTALPAPETPPFQKSSGNKISPQGSHNSSMSSLDFGGRSRQGKRRYKYLGKNSEGNRFIKDNDL